MEIINGRILTMEGETYPCGYVRTKGKYIQEAGAMEAYQKQDEDA